MKITGRITPGILCLGLILALFSGCGDSRLGIAFANETDWGLTAIHIFDSRALDQGPDLLGDTGTLKAGEQAELSIAAAPDGLYNLHCRDEEGDVWMIDRVPLSKGASLALYLSQEGYPMLVVTGKDGDLSEITGEFQASPDRLAALPEPEPTAAPVPAPSKDDPLDMTYDLQSYPGGILIAYPSTMQVLRENADTRTVWLDAVNDPDTGNNICIDFIQITDFDKYFNSGEDQARAGLNKLLGIILEKQYQDDYINSIASEFINGGSFYGLREFVWFSGEYFEDGGNAPIRAVIELRYAGPVGYLLCVVTAADEGAIQRYFEVSLNIIDTISFGGGWSTQAQGGGSSGGGSGWSDPGDWDYDPWSDPGDWDYDPWSDPGDNW